MSFLLRAGIVAVVALAITMAVREHGELVTRAHTLQTQRNEAEAALLAERSARADAQRRVENLTRIANDAHEQLTAAQVDAAASYRAAERLRQQLAARVAADTAACDTGAAGGGQSVADRATADLLSGMLQKHSRELVEVGQYADRLRIAGAACEAAYQSLSAEDLH
jgi:hypothetical protein